MKKAGVVVMEVDHTHPCPHPMPSANHNPISIAGDWFRNGHMANLGQCEVRRNLLECF